MKKVALIHCYSDQNRGDAGIIESTIDLINEIEPGCKVSAISVFNENDERFKNDHYFTKNIVEGVHPALFFEPSIQKNGIGFSNFKKSLLFLLLFVKNVIILLFPYRFVAKRLLSQAQFSTFVILCEADLVISKGGSFLYSFKGMTGELFLTRMLFAFLLPIRLGKKVCIFSQSIGPFENFISKRLFLYVIGKLKGVYLREEKCLEYLPFKYQGLVTVIPDSAFYLSPKPCSFQSTAKKRVAITARPHKFSSNKQKQARLNEQYINCLILMAKHCLHLGFEVNLVGQVTGPSSGEDDREALKLLYSGVGVNTTGLVFWDETKGLMSPKELQYIYSKMDLVIGTRLHSAIFSLAVGIPSINIAYHGTKSQGIMASVGLERFVMDINDMQPGNGIKLIDEMLGWNQATDKISASVNLHRAALKDAMTEFMV